jgi:hypothetical protein
MMAKPIGSKAAMDDLCKAYRERGLVLALGAGVTVTKAQYMPNWPTLLGRIFDLARKEDASVPKYEELLDPLKDSLIAASIAKQIVGEKFVSSVREALYKNFPLYRKNMSEPANKRKLIELVENEFRTLRAVADFLAVKSGTTYVANPLVHGVVTTNFDTLLRDFMLCQHGIPLLRTVERASAGSQADKISMYYVHGHLRFDKHFGVRTKEGCDQLVLAEDEFFSAYARPHAIFNYTWLYLLREHPTLFIGFSFSDPNVRRLLWLSCSERAESYAREGVVARRSKLVPHFAIWKRRENKSEEPYVEAWLANLGVAVVWVSDYDEIPEIMSKVYECRPALVSR